MDNIKYKNKYLKYKKKYINLKFQKSGSLDNSIPLTNIKIYYCDNSKSIEINDINLYRLLDVLEERDTISSLKEKIIDYINSDLESKPEIFKNLKQLTIHNILIYKNDKCIFPNA